LESKYRAGKNANLYSAENDKEEFLQRAEAIKKNLSKQAVVKENLKGDKGSCLVEISQDEFEEKISTYISQTELLVEQALHEANMKPKDVDYILLVGGSTRIPAFVKSLKNIFGKEPLSKVNVDEAVALGAAISAGLKTVAENPQKMTANMVRELKSTKLTDVANASYGVISITQDEKLNKEVPINSIIIKKNTPLPCSATDTFYTMVDNQQAVDIRITQGEGSDPDFVDKIGQTIMSLPSGRPKGQKIEVTYEYDENQRMKCTFKDIASGDFKEVEFNLNKKSGKALALDLGDILVE
jgi:molecular chaperone DnaK